jgi:hypothetical protein
MCAVVVVPIISASISRLIFANHGLRWIAAGRVRARETLWVTAEEVIE